MLIGYARVSTHEQDNQTQINVLSSSGCEKIYQETASGGRPPKLTTAQQQQIIEMVSSGQKSAAYAARLFRVHPSTVTRLMAGSGRISAYNDH